MTLFGTRIQDFILLAAYVAAGLALGAALERLTAARLRAAARRRAWDGWDAIVRGLGHMPVWWMALAGGAAALERLAWSAHAETLIGKALLVCAGLTITIAATRIATGLVRVYAEAAEGAAASSTIFINLTRVVVVLLGALLVLNALNISITPILTALGVGGLAVALALQDTLSNLFGGIQIVASKQVRPGDLLELDSGKRGYVEDITWRYTALRTPSNNRVVVPNALLSKAVITNYSLPDAELAITVDVTVANGSDLALVERVTTEAARETMASVEPSIAGFEPSVRFKAFTAAGVTLGVGLRSAEPGGQYLLRSELIKRLQARYAAEGIEMPPAPSTTGLPA